jgi:L-rhamnose mutarotase
MNIHENIKKQFIQNKASWINSSKIGLTVNSKNDFIPWYCFDAINYLEKKITNSDNIFEFGCGASTLFFFKKKCRIISLETNKKWFKAIINLVLTNSDNIKFSPIINDNYFKFNNLEIYLIEDGLNNDEYQNFSINIANKKNILFDYIVVDSLKRHLCCINSLDALKPSGTIILDDSERKNYQKTFDFFAKKNFLLHEFIGIAPAQLKLKKTSFFSKKSNV